MKNKLLFSAIIFLLAGAAVYYDLSNRPDSYRTEQPLSPAAAMVPDIDFTDLSGDRHHLHDLAAPVILLHFWASWCVVCMAEFPDLLAFIDRQQGKAVLVSVSIDQERDKMDRALARLQKDYPAQAGSPSVFWVWDKDKQISLETFHVTTPPETIIINSDRQMVDKLVGGVAWLDNEVKALMEAWLRE